MPRLRSIASVRRHPVIAALVALIALFLIVRAVLEGRLAKGLAYLAGMFACVVATDLIVDRLERRRDGRAVSATDAFPVRDPEAETTVVIGCAIIGSIALAVSLGTRHQSQTPGVAILGTAVRLVALALVFSIVPAVYLLIRGYRPRSLGYALPHFSSALAVVVAVAAITAGTALSAAPDDITWTRGLAESGGILALLLSGAVAAVTEEFFRLMVQTRLGALVGNQATAWLTAAILWALLHTPKLYWSLSPEHRGPSVVFEVALGSMTMVPLGLMWSYVAWRTRSLWPSMVLHATNYWGLQNS